MRSRMQKNEVSWLLMYISEHKKTNINNNLEVAPDTN